MDNQTNKYSGFFKLFNPDNLQVSFNVVGDTTAGFLGDFHDLLNDLLNNRNYTVNPQGLDSTEEIREVQGWVLGSYNDRNTGKKEHCAYLYGPDYLEFKVATVWLEDLEKMPFSIPKNEQPWKGNAPKRSDAVSEEVFHMVHPPFKVVMEQATSFDGTVRTTDEGKPIMRFSRILGQPKEKEPKKNGGEEGSDGEDIDFYQAPLESVDSFEDIGNVIDPSTQAGKLIKWTKGKQKEGDDITAEVKLDFLVGVVDEITKEKGSGSAVLSVLSGVDILELPETLTANFVDSLLNIICDVVIDDHGTPIGNNTKVKKERYVKAIQDIHESVKTALEANLIDDDIPM